MHLINKHKDTFYYFFFVLSTTVTWYIGCLLRQSIYHLYSKSLEVYLPRGIRLIRKNNNPFSKVCTYSINLHKKFPWKRTPLIQLVVSKTTQRTHHIWNQYCEVIEKQLPLYCLGKAKKACHINIIC